MTYTVIAELEGETFKLVTGSSRQEVESHIAEFLLYGLTIHAHQLKAFYYPQVQKNVILSYIIQMR
ncbi:hypothetical protein, partial [Bacillus cereus]|uniref:hypothetical protein n=1 Tax=Bacillus cereus TaxID=1396 RepID=UPI001C12B0A2